LIELIPPQFSLNFIVKFAQNITPIAAHHSINLALGQPIKLHPITNQFYRTPTMVTVQCPPN